MGAGAAKRVSAVRWGVAGNIVVAWMLTLPAAAAIGGATYGVTRHLRHRRGRAGRSSRSLILVAMRRGVRAPGPAGLADHGGGGLSVLPVADSVVDWGALLDVVMDLAAGPGSA